MASMSMIALAIEGQVHALLSLNAWRDLAAQLQPQTANHQPQPSPQEVIGHVLHVKPMDDNGALDGLERWWRTKANALEFTTEGGIRDLISLLVRDLVIAPVRVDADDTAAARTEAGAHPALRAHDSSLPMLATLDMSHEIGTINVLQQNAALLLHLVSGASTSLRTFNASLVGAVVCEPPETAARRINAVCSNGASLTTHMRAWPMMHALCTLRLNGQPLGCAGVRDLAASLPKFPALKHLELQGVGCGSKGGAALASGVGAVAATLEILDVSDNTIGCGSVFKLLTALAAGAEGPRLEVVGFRQTGLGPNTSPSVGAALSRFAASLRRLDLSCNALGVSGASSLAPYLAELRSLRRLDLRNNHLGDAGVVALCPMLQVQLLSGRLTSLCLANNRCQALGADALAKALATGGGGLCDLSLPHNRLTSLGWRTLGQSLSNVKALRALDVAATGLVLASGTGADDRSTCTDLTGGVASFARGLRMVPHGIRCLVLDGNALDVHAMHLVATAIRRMQCLEALSMCSCRLGDEAVGYLADNGLMESSGLRSLLLGRNAFGASGMQRLALQLPTLSNLEVLDVSDTPLGGLGGAQLGAYLDAASTLHTLRIDGTRLGDGGAAALAAGIAGLPALRCLYLDQAVVGAQGVDALATQLMSSGCLTRRIQVLTLRGNAFGDAGMLHLCRPGVLDAMVALETLDVSHALFEDAGARALVAALSRLGCASLLGGASLGIDGSHPLRSILLNGNVTATPADAIVMGMLSALARYARIGALGLSIGNGVPLAANTRAACEAFAAARCSVLATFDLVPSTANR